MKSSQKFCTECGGLLVPDTRFCGHCGCPVEGQHPESSPAILHSPVMRGASTSGGPERIIGIVPFLEQGLLSVIHYTLLVTPQRLIFCTWNACTDEVMSEADDEVMLKSCEIAETVDEIAHFRAKDWTTGPWQRYLSMPIESIASGAPGSITIPMDEISWVDIVCENRTSTQDNLSIEEGGRRHTFDLMYSQGPFLFKLLQPILGERIRIADQLHKQSGLDRLLTGQEYK